MDAEQIVHDVAERVRAVVSEAEQRAAKIVRSTHERYDGNGYPDQLSGEEIPLASRIIAVCDSFDAMTSDRPYRTAMSPEGALSELRRGAGTQFDPTVVEAFIATMAGGRRAGAAAGDAEARS